VQPLAVRWWSGASDTQLLHLGVERRWLQPEDARCSSGTTDSPGGDVQCRDNGVSFSGGK
jgi:hypothetical protein